MLCGVAGAERLRAPDGGIEDVPDKSAEFALRDGYTRIPTVRMRTPEGIAVSVYEDSVEEAKARGYWRMTPSEIESEELDAFNERNAKLTAEVEAKEKRDLMWAAFLFGLPTVAAAGLLWRHLSKR